MSFRLLSFLAVTVLAAPFARAQQDQLEPAAFQERIAQKDAQLVDVRTPEEFAKGHIAGATNIDWLAEGFMEQAGKLDKSKPVLLYCASGGRSGEALEAMKKAGYTKAVHLSSGINGWKRGNLPVTTK